MMAIIALDFGHGGHDPGAVGKKSKEKDNVLKVGLRLGELLEEMGHTVIYIRKTDKFVSLSERANIANKNNVDYFISLHNNSAVSTATGFETFIYNGNVSAKTIELQNAIHNPLAANLGIHDRGKKRANFAVLRETNMPAVLIEYAFISNQSDETILINEVEKLAMLTAEGIRKVAGGKAVATQSPTQTGPFKDVPENHWAVDAIKYVKDNGLMVGHTDGTFAPNDTVTRAQLAQVLFNMRK